MAALEAGAIANPDEKRMVGHYWLRAPRRADARAPSRDHETLRASRPSPSDVHDARVRGERRDTFSDLLVIGIGGSALGPEFVAEALGPPGDRMTSHLPRQHRSRRLRPRPFDASAGHLAATLTVVISKSGGTKETRNGMLEAARRLQGRGPRLRQARRRHHRRRSRTRQATPTAKAGSRASPCGTGSAAAPASSPPSACCPPRCRASTSTPCSPARAAMRRGHPHARSRAEPRRPARAHVVLRDRTGAGTKDMVVLPYKDRLLLFSPLPPAARHGVARQGARPRRARSCTRASPSTATRARPTSTPTCSSCARA